MDYLTTTAASAVAYKILNTLTNLFKTRFEAPLKAKAEAKAAVIKEEGQHELILLEHENKALEIAELSGFKGVYQTNVKSIIFKAIQLANEMNASPSEEAVDNGWILSFIDGAKNISDEHIQNLWSKILAGEINLPGSFSLRTLGLLTQISKKEADLFTEFCSYLIIIEGSATHPCYFTDTYGAHGNRFVTRIFSQQERILLSEIGLVNFEEDIFFSFKYEYSHSLLYNCKKLLVTYKGKEKRGAPEEIKTIICGYQLTRSGKELFNICSPTFHQDFFKNTKETLLSLGFEIGVLRGQWHSVKQVLCVYTSLNECNRLFFCLYPCKLFKNGYRNGLTECHCLRG